MTPLLVMLEACTAVALVGGGAWGARAWLGLDGRERAGLIGLFALAWVVRQHAPAVPHDVNFRAWGAYTEGALDIDRGYGFPAWARLWHPLVGAWSADERWLFHAGAWVGALAPIALFAWLRRHGAVLAWAAALLMALATPHVRFSHTDAQQIPALTLGLIGLAAWQQHARAPTWALACIGAAATTAAACARMEWAAWPVFALGILIADGLRPRHAATWIGWLATAGVTVTHVVAMMTDNRTWQTAGYAHGVGSVLLEHPLWRVGPAHLIWLDPAFTPVPLAALIVAGLFVSPLPRVPRAGLAIAAIGLSCVVPNWSPIHAAAFAISRYQLWALPFVAALAAGPIAVAWSRTTSRAARLLLILGTATLGAWRLPLDWAPTTMSAEYTFVRDTLPRLPRDCVLVIDAWTTDSGLAFPTHLAAALRPDLRVVTTDAWTPDLSVCTLYYQAATCHSFANERETDPIDPDFCVGVGAGYTLKPVVEATLPKRQWSYDQYTLDPVPVGFFQITPEGAP